MSTAAMKRDSPTRVCPPTAAHLPQQLHRAALRLVSLSTLLGHDSDSLPPLIMNSSEHLPSSFPSHLT
jgi:hypothetical protein